MPPKRSSRASTRGPESVASEPEKSRASIPRTTPARLRSAAVIAAMEASPAKYSTSYGSPPTAVPERQVLGAHGTDLAGAFGAVLDTVQEDNRSDARKRAERDADEARRKNRTDRSRRGAEEQENGPLPFDDDNDDDDEDDVDLIETIEPQEQITPRPQTRTYHGRSSSVQPSSAMGPRGTVLNVSSSVRRLFSEPPSQRKSVPNLSMSTRSFIEESSVFGNARVFTPGPSPNAEVLARRGGLAARNQARPIADVKNRPPLPESRTEESSPPQPPRNTRFRPSQEDASSPPTETAAAKSRDNARKIVRRLQAGVSDEDELQSSPPQLRQRVSSTRKSPRTARRLNDSESGEEDEAMPLPRRRQDINPKLDRSNNAFRPEARNVLEVATASVSLARRASRHRPMQAEDDEREEPIGKNTQGQRAPSLPRIDEEEPVRRQNDPEARRATSPQPAEGRKAPDETERKPMGYMEKIWLGLTKASTAIALFVLGLVIVRIIVISTTAPEEYDGFRLDNRLHWYGSDWRSNIQQFVPYSLLHPLGAISDDEFNDINTRWSDHANQINKLRHSDRALEAALAKLEKILPSVVQLDMDNKGKPIVPEDFWYALRDLIIRDDKVFTLQKSKNGKLDISDLQWRTLQERLEKGGYRTQKNDALSSTEIESIAEKTMAKSWDNWFKGNSNRIKALLGMDKMNLEGTDQEMAERLRELQDLKGTLVTKDQFIRQLHNEMVVQRSEIKGELAELEAKLQQFVNDAKDTTNSPTNGLSQKEIVALVEKAVRKAIGDRQLEAMAEGKINAKWSNELSHRVNWFGYAAGAIINVPFSSPTFLPPQARMHTRSWLRKLPIPGLGRDRSASGYEAPRHRAVLESWEDDGDCWCAGILAGHDNETRPADIAVQLGIPVIPQHFVVEHISPSATLDPDAMPRDFEVWAKFPEHNQKRTMQAWSVSQFADDDTPLQLQRGYNEARLARMHDYGYVKIGEFAYENGGAAGGGGDGVMVHKFSQELVNLEAATEEVLVRALTNHGAEDHTCFYRIRLYGERRDEL